MKKVFCIIFITFTCSIFSSTYIPANDSNISYFGRWDFSAQLNPTHSWPGVYIKASFEGTSFGIRMADKYCYYNIFIDDMPVIIFKGTSKSMVDYNIVNGLKEGKHKVLITKRNETTVGKYGFGGFILDDGKKLLDKENISHPKIEFIGDSFTSAQGNEYVKEDKPEDDTKITNNYEGYAAVTSRYFDADYQIASRSGYGMVVDWTGNSGGNLPDIFDRITIPLKNSKWDFSKFQPDLVVINLGLNDYSGFGGYDKKGVSKEDTELFIRKYNDFVESIKSNYPNAKILCIATHLDWTKEAVDEVIKIQNNKNFNKIYSLLIPQYSEGYVYGGHPSVEIHNKMAQEIINVINKFELLK